MPQSSVDKVAVTAVSMEQLAAYDAASVQVGEFATPQLYRQNDPHSRIFFALFDGTRNDATAHPHHITNIGLLAEQIDRAGQADPHVAGFYKAGPGTQKGITGIFDAALGTTFGPRIEAMYEKFIDQSSRWLAEDPRASIGVISVGFSRGAEQAAAFCRLVEERGVQNPEARTVDSFLGIEQVHFAGSPLCQPGTIPQALALYDPVGTGEPTLHDRRPPPSVISGLQINAGDEFRALFPSTSIIGQGRSVDGRFLGITTAGAHSDIGGGYQLNGLSRRNFNIMAQYLNGLVGEPMIEPVEVPADPAKNVVHDTPWYYLKVEARKVIYKLEPSGQKVVEALNPVFEPLHASRQQHQALAQALRSSAAMETAPSALAVLTIDDTRTAAFEDIGRNEEIARILHDAAEKFAGGQATPFPLQDTNGNDVGQFDIVSAGTHSSTRGKGLYLELDLSRDAFRADRTEQISRSIGEAAEQIGRLSEDASFAILAQDRTVLGQVVMPPPVPIPELTPRTDTALDAPAA